MGLLRRGRVMTKYIITQEQLSQITNLLGEMPMKSEAYVKGIVQVLKGLQVLETREEGE